MRRLTKEIRDFFQNQGFAIVSTIDENGNPHNSCKGIVKIRSNGLVYLLDLYKNSTYKNIKRNPFISITAVDEHKFIGYCLKGKAKIVAADNLPPAIIATWEKKITDRITNRVLKNIQGQKGHQDHPESLLPKPQYLMVMLVKSIVDLTPTHIKRGRMI